METINQTLQNNYPRLMLAAPASGTGKTLLTCGLLRLLQRRGARPAAFKCGPDYIDPMFHKKVLGIPSRNLDTFFSPGQNPAVPSGGRWRNVPAGSEQPGDGPGPASADEFQPVFNQNSVREILTRAARQSGADISVIEGVMGYFDGTGASGLTASSFDLANRTQTPVILVVSARGMSRSVVPLVRGFEEYERELIRSGEAIRSPQGRQGPAENRPEKAVRTDADRPGWIRGVILNRISAGMYPLMKRWIEQDTDLRVVGYVPQETEISWESRHLGLLQPEEISGLQQQIDHLAERMEKTIDMEALLDLARSAPALPEPEKKTMPRNSFGLPEPGDRFCKETGARETGETGVRPLSPKEPGAGAEKETGVRPLSPKTSPAVHAPRVAVARDEAFSFYYEDNLELLRECGADLVFFSPIHDKDLPAADGLLLGGGYPELHAQELADNSSMRAQIRARAAEGLPILAECGGFMYLQEELEIEGRRLPMCGALPGICRMTDRLVRFGYLELENRLPENRLPENRLPEKGQYETGLPENREGNQETTRPEVPAYLQAGHCIRGHEFHYFDSTCNGDACTAYKPGRRRSWDCMVAQGNIMAGFPHLYYRSDPAFAQAFVDRCREYSREKR